MKFSTTAKVLVALVLIIAAGVLHIAFNVTDFFGRGGDLRWVNTGRGVSYTVDAGAVFHGHESPFFFIATRDGVRYVSQFGESRWYTTMTLRRPILWGQGGYIAVSEGDRGRVVSVFDANGLAFSESFDYPVHTFSVNRNGFLSVILQMDDGYAVQAFHRQSVYRPMFRIVMREADHPGVIPLMSEMSDDGRVIALGLLDVRGRLHSKIQFRYTYRGDGWGTHGIFAEVSLEDQMLFHMRKTSNNRLVAITDTQIIVYTRDANDRISTTATIPLYNHLVDVAFDESGRFAVALGAAFLNAAVAEPMGTVKIFDPGGTQIGTFEAGRRVTSLSMGHGGVIVGKDRNFTAITVTGERLWEYIALQDTRDFLFLENSDTVLIAGASRADVWRRQRTRDGEAGDFFGIQGQEQ
ncbi:MAG: DUF5711 family protein [Defluviitaleaceae bacterium]|nr:DUF5711 family protein [Defluviitaleaceae bacterium]MCL2239406.1 DUF5711 family protein [Defluviitaleaceae bacterium]